MAHRFRFISALMFGFVVANGASATEVALGTDYFETTTGTMFNFGGSIGTVDFVGYPIGPEKTDTIIERTDNVAINGATGGDLLMTALSLESTTQVMGQTVYVTLDPAELGRDTGTIMIMGSSADGTFNSMLDVFFDVCLAPGAGGVGCAGGATPLFTDMVALSQTGASWLPTPLPGSVIVEGPVGDQAANVHTGLPNADLVDFFPGTLMEQHPGGGVHAVIQASVPETSTWIMLLVGFGGLGAVGLARRRRTGLIAC
jgi:hypothetical protein